MRRVRRSAVHLAVPDVSGILTASDNFHALRIVRLVSDRTGQEEVSGRMYCDE